jgi:hypothetical protein
MRSVRLRYCFLAGPLVVIALAAYWLSPSPAAAQAPCPSPVATPGVSFGPTAPYPILVVGNGANSNFVLALQGVGPLFDNNTGAFGEMPANANPPAMPFVTSEEIQPITVWINNGCPNPGGS